jgi:hypothetical protein
MAGQAGKSIVLVVRIVYNDKNKITAPLEKHFSHRFIIDDES